MFASSEHLVGIHDGTSSPEPSSVVYIKNGMGWLSHLQKITVGLNCLKSYVIKDNYIFVRLSLFYLQISDLSS